MMLQGILIAVTTLSVALIIKAVGHSLARSPVKCSECGSRRYGMVMKEPLGMRQGGHGAGGPGGGYMAVILDYRLVYSCAKCRAQWTETVSEAS